MADSVFKTEDGKDFTRSLVLNTRDLVQRMKLLEQTDGPKRFTWEQCEAICRDYMAPEKRKRFLDSGESFLKELREHVPAAHSIRLRLKGVVSLARKIIIKRSDAEDRSKYVAIDHNNYDKLVTDLIGARILIRYKHQWSDVHKQVQELFHNGDKHRINSSIDSNESISNILSLLHADDDCCYFYERPVAYVHDETEKPLYVCSEGLSEEQVLVSKSGYRSVHYIIRYFGQHIELQVRTIFEEGWSECDHDLYYKEPDPKLKNIQGKMSGVLSGLAHQADEMSSLMFAMKSEDNTSRGAEAGNET